jgi:Sec-independent protein translocase protein TatA
MFGISGPEFLVIVLVAVLVIPSRMWPDVARILARIVRVVRDFMWRITDASEKLKTQIDLERPIDDLIKTTTDDILADFSTKRNKVKKSTRPRKTAGRKK